MTFDLQHYQHKRGIERESLRILHSGRPATSDHPLALGSKLTNSNITVDFSEGLVELITEPFYDISSTFSRLTHILGFCSQNLAKDELLLATSMPLTATEDEIKVAHFGTSNSGKMKEVYRRGLAQRYGKIMQVISGVHYNFSYDVELINRLNQERNLSSDALYFSAINHYFDFMWLIPYLFGSSPICAKTSVKQTPEYLKTLNDDFYIAEYATSLRMSGLGYQSPAQKDLYISYASLKDYVYDLINATKTTYPPFEKIGLYADNGSRQQLSTSILQIENEYYSSIRPKQITKRCERPACALLNRGVAYLEVRVVDVNPFDPLGIDETTAHFIEALLLSCLLQPKKQYQQSEIMRNKANFAKVVTHGRKPRLQLKDNQGKDISLKDFGVLQLELIAHTAQSMGDKYFQAVMQQFEKLTDPGKTLSAQLIDHAGKDYAQTVLELSRENTQGLQKVELSKDSYTGFSHQTAQSLVTQQALEESDCCDLESYIDHYYLSANCSNQK